MKPTLKGLLLLIFLLATSTAIHSALQAPGPEMRRTKPLATEAREAIATADFEAASTLLLGLRQDLRQSAPAALAFLELRLGLSTNDPTLVNAALERIETFELAAGLWPFAAAWFASATAAEELQRAGEAAASEEELSSALAAARQSFDAATAAVIERREDWPEAQRNAERLFRRLAALEARIAANRPEEQAPKSPPPPKENKQPEEPAGEVEEAPLQLPGKTRLLTASEIAELQKRLEAKEGQKRTLREKTQREGARGEDW